MSERRVERKLARALRASLNAFGEQMIASAKQFGAPSDTGALRGAHTHRTGEDAGGVWLAAGWYVTHLVTRRWRNPKTDHSPEHAEGFPLLKGGKFDYGEYQYRGRYCPKGGGKPHLKYAPAMDHWLARYADSHQPDIHAALDQAVNEAFTEWWAMLA